MQLHTDVVHDTPHKLYVMIGKHTNFRVMAVIACGTNYMVQCIGLMSTCYKAKILYSA